MEQVYQAIRRAATRLWLQDIFGTLTVVSTCVLVALILTRLVEQLFGLDHVFASRWPLIGYGAAGATALITLAWTIIRNRRALAVAVELDERAGLKESLSTALYLEKVDDPWARAMLETAAEKLAADDPEGAAALQEQLRCRGGRLPPRSLDSPDASRARRKSWRSPTRPCAAAGCRAPSSFIYATSVPGPAMDGSSLPRSTKNRTKK